MNKEMVEGAYGGLIDPNSRLNRGYRRVLGWLRMGHNWTPAGFQQLYRHDQIYLEDFECKLMAMDLPLTWKQIRAAFPEMMEVANAMPV